MSCNTIDLSVVWLCYSVDKSVKNLVITASDTAPPPTVSPPSRPLHPNPTWPTPSGIDEAEARKICQAAILQSAVYDVCSNFTEQSLDFITRSCMLDLQVQY